YPRRRQGHHATEHLTAQDGRIQVPRRLPRDLTVADHEHPSGARVHGEATHTTASRSSTAGAVPARARGGVTGIASPGAVARSISSIVATQRPGPVAPPGTRAGTTDNTCHRDHRGAVGLVGFTEHPAHRERIPCRCHMAVHALHVAVRVLATAGSVVGHPCLLAS